MTIIIALKDEKNNKIYLGADKQGTSGDVSFQDFGCKLLKMEIPLDDEGIDEMYLAISGSSFLHQYLWNVFKAPVYNTTMSFVEYLYTCFFKKLKNELVEQKLIYDDNGVLDSEASLICVHKDSIYNVYDNFAVVKSPRIYGINGSGYKIALSVIENNLEFHPDMDYYKIVEEALYTTGKLNIYCSNEYEILTIDY